MASLSMDQLPHLRGLRGLGQTYSGQRAGESEEEFFARMRASQEAEHGGRVRRQASSLATRSVPASVSSQKGSSVQAVLTRQTSTSSSSDLGVPRTARGRSRAQEVVDRQREQAAPIQQTVDRSSTTIYQPGISQRPRRVSPLSAPLPLSLQPTPPFAASEGGRGLTVGWVAIGAVVLLGGAALYMALGE